MLIGGICMAIAAAAAGSIAAKGIANVAHFNAHQDYFGADK